VDVNQRPAGIADCTSDDVAQRVVWHNVSHASRVWCITISWYSLDLRLSLNSQSKIVTSHHVLVDCFPTRSSDDDITWWPCWMKFNWLHDVGWMLHYTCNSRFVCNSIDLHVHVIRNLIELQSHFMYCVSHVTSSFHFDRDVPVLHDHRYVNTFD